MYKEQYEALLFDEKNHLSKKPFVEKIISRKK